MKLSFLRILCVFGILLNLTILIISPIGIIPRIITKWHNEHEVRLKAGNNWTSYEDECCIVCGQKGFGKVIASTSGGSRIAVCNRHEGRAPTSMGIYLFFHGLFALIAFIVSAILIFWLIKLLTFRKESFLSWRLDDEMTLGAGIFTLIFGAIALQIINWLLRFYFWADPSVYLKAMGIL